MQFLFSPPLLCYNLTNMITVILCSYNGSSYLRAQLDSILNQNAGDFRVQVFDDASTDATAEILREYRSRYPDRFSFTVREQPTGSATRNFLKAIYEAGDSDYYMLCDQDDIWHHSKIRKMLAVMKIHESAYEDGTPVLVHSDARVVNDRGEVIASSFIRFAGLSPELTGLNHMLIQNQVTGAACIFNKAMRDVLVSVRMPEHAFVHDHWIGITATAFGKIFYLNETLYDYRQHGSNVLGAKKAGMVKETLRRLGLGEESKAEIDAITAREFAGVFAQAAEFLELYGGKLDRRQAAMVKAFASIPRMKKAEKIATVLRYGFTFNKFYRAVGECIFI